MTPADSARSKVNLVSLLGALILFLLPWTEVTCGKQTVATQTGFEATYGGITLDEKVRDFAIDGKKAKESDEAKVPAAAVVSVALFVLVCAAGIALLALMPGYGMRVPPGVLSFVALVLIAVQAIVGFPMDKQFEGKPTDPAKPETDISLVRRTPWFWAECAALLVPAALFLSERRKSRAASSRAP